MYLECSRDEEETGVSNCWLPVYFYIISYLLHVSFPFVSTGATSSLHTFNFEFAWLILIFYVCFPGQRRTRVKGWWSRTVLIQNQRVWLCWCQTSRRRLRSSTLPPPACGRPTRVGAQTAARLAGAWCWTVCSSKTETSPQPSGLSALTALLEENREIKLEFLQFLQTRTKHDVKC